MGTDGIAGQQFGFGAVRRSPGDVEDVDGCLTDHDAVLHQLAAWDQLPISGRRVGRRGAPPSATRSPPRRARSLVDRH